MTATPTGSSLVLTGGEQSPTRGRARRAPVTNRLARPDVLDQTDAANPNTTAGGLRIGWAPGGLRMDGRRAGTHPEPLPPALRGSASAADSASKPARGTRW